MNALGVILQDVVLYWPLRLYRRALTVAFTAGERYVERIHRRAPVFDRQDVVVAVAVDAARRQRIAAGYRLAVQRLGMQLGFAAVASPAVHLGYRRVMREILAFERSMTRGTGKRSVNRRRELLSVHIDGDGLSTVLRGQALVVMAGKTIGVAG